MELSGWHIKVNSGSNPDLYAKPQQGSLWEDSGCGCLIAPCGFAEAQRDCQFHGDKPVVKIHGAHLSKNCPHHQQENQWPRK